MKLSILIFLLMFTLNSCDSDKKGFEFSNFNDTPVSHLAKAVKNNDIFSIRTILKDDKIDVDYREPYNYQTLLSLAIVNKKKEAFLELLKSNANPNILLGPQENSSPLILAIKKQHYCELFYIKNLLDNGADPNMLILPRNGMVFDDNFPLFTAIGKGVNGDECLGIIQLLIEYGANINACNPKPIVDGMCEGVVEKCLTYGCMEFLRYFIVERKIEIPEIVYVRGGINPATQEKYNLTEILNTEDYQFEDYPSTREARNGILDFLNEKNSPSRK